MTKNAKSWMHGFTVGKNQLPCSACVHYRAGEHMNQGRRYCYMERVGFPNAGPTCREFTREPGADDE